MNTNLKLKFYYDFVLGQVYDEGHSPFHQAITKDVVEKFIDPMNLPKTAEILDLGCGPGYFLDEMKQRGYINMTGLTLSPGDIEICQEKGHKISRSDMNFLAQADESQDLLFCRHSLEHSPFPYITLLEYNRVLKPRGYLYIEVPQPNCDQTHENNRNHYSILDKTMWLSLLSRTGFDVTWYEYCFPVEFLDERGSVEEKYYIFVCQRQRSVDVK
jgi:ubiquinone/menaquinone biosynthesis C-methylase UbiE